MHLLQSMYESELYVELKVLGHVKVLNSKYREIDTYINTKTSHKSTSWNNTKSHVDITIT